MEDSEAVPRRSSFSAPVGSLGVVELETGVQVDLQIVEGFVTCGAAIPVEMLVQRGPVQAFG